MDNIQSEMGFFTVKMFNVRLVEIEGGLGFVFSKEEYFANPQAPDMLAELFNALILKDEGRRGYITPQYVTSKVNNIQSIPGVLIMLRPGQFAEVKR